MHLQNADAFFIKKHVKSIDKVYMIPCNQTNLMLL